MKKILIGIGVIALFLTVIIFYPRNSIKASFSIDNRTLSGFQGAATTNREVCGFEIQGFSNFSQVEDMGIKNKSKIIKINNQTIHIKPKKPIPLHIFDIIRETAETDENGTYTLVLTTDNKEYSKQINIKEPMGMDLSNIYCGEQ